MTLLAIPIGVLGLILLAVGTHSADGMLVLAGFVLIMIAYIIVLIHFLGEE